MSMRPKMKRLAHGGMAESSIIKPRLRSEIDEDAMQHSRSMKEQSPEDHPAAMDIETPEEKEYMKDKVEMLAQGGKVKSAMVQPEPEAEEEHHASIAAAIMAKRRRMAEGGRVVPEHPGDEMLKEGEVDIDDNARELPNAYYHQNEDEVLEHNFDADMMDVEQPMDSNQMNDPREDEESDRHDMVSRIRRKMSMKRQFSKE